MARYEVLVNAFTQEGTAHAKGSTIELEEAVAQPLVDSGKIALSPAKTAPSPRA